MTITEPSQTCVCVRRACACCRQCILTIVSSASGIIELDEIVHKILEMTITKPNEMGEDVLDLPTDALGEEEEDEFFRKFFSLSLVGEGCGLNVPGEEVAPNSLNLFLTSERETPQSLIKLL